MRHINIISFPRSGQHLLQSIIKYVCLQHNLYYKFCEYYKCCKSIPCKYNSNYLKNHDFYNKLSILDNTKYIVLYRKDKILQLESWYRLNIKMRKKKYKFKKLISFIKRKTSYYNTFINKWVNNTNESILKVEYYDLVNNPVYIIKKLLNHIYPNVTFNQNIINNIASTDFSVSHPSKNDSLVSKIAVQHKLDPELYSKILESL